MQISGTEDIPDINKKAICRVKHHQDIGSKHELLILSHYASLDMIDCQHCQDNENSYHNNGNQAFENLMWVHIH